MNKNGYSLIQIILIIGIVSALITVAYFLGKNSLKTDNGLSSQEAQIIQQEASDSSEILDVSPLPSPKPNFVFKKGMYTNNKNGFSFQVSDTLVLNNDSTADFAQFLEPQDGIGMATRLVAQVYKNPQNLSLEQIIQDKRLLENDTYGLNHERIIVDGHEAIKLSKVLSQKDLCNEGDTTGKERVFHMLIKGDGYVVDLIPTNSCESFTRNWFDITQNSFKWL